MIKAEWTNNDALSAEQVTQTNAPNAPNTLNALDCISRQAAIDALMNNEPSAWNNDDYERGEIARFREDLTIIKNVPSARQKRKSSAQPEITDADVQDYCRKRDLVVITYELFHEMQRRWSETAQPEPRWIAVEYRPPEFGKEVLISHKGTVSIDWLTQSEGSAYFFMSGAGIADIDAWMPLPKPYERSKDGSQN